MKNKLPRLSACWIPLVVLALFSACVPASKTIRSDGLKAIRLGDELPAEGTPKLRKIALRDSMIEEGEYTWRAVLMEYREGLVYLEEDFYGSGELSRVRVETPELRLKNGLRVGDSVADLQSKSNKWYIVPLPEYRLFDFYSRTFPRLHFIVDDPARGMEEEDWKAFQIDQFAPGARIVAVVVH